jgi:acyl-CoA synthetase (AMP-forming)/AMP-acid ligase II
MPAALLDRAINAFGPVLYQQYGLTESAGMVAGLAAAEHSPEYGERRFSVGRALPGYHVECRDDLGMPVSTGKAGEIVFKAATVMVGYWNQPELTDKALKDGVLWTGDVGRLDDQGYLWIVDRKKEMIISGGENIYPKEVESVLSRHPAIAEVAIVGLPHPRWGEAVTAYVVPRKNEEISSGVVIEYCRAHLASYKKPQQVIFVDALPRTGVGKIDKPALRRMAHGET